MLETKQWVTYFIENSYFMKMNVYFPIYKNNWYTLQKIENMQNIEK